MPYNSSQEIPGEAERIFLQGEVTIQRVAQLKELLRQALERVECLTLDLSEASSFDVSGLQLLCSAHRFANSLNKSLTLIGRRPTELESTLRAAGFGHDVGCGPSCSRECLWS